MSLEFECISPFFKYIILSSCQTISLESCNWVCINLNLILPWTFASRKNLLQFHLKQLTHYFKKKFLNFFDKCIMTTANYWIITPDCHWFIAAMYEMTFSLFNFFLRLPINWLSYHPTIITRKKITIFFSQHIRQLDEEKKIPVLLFLTILQSHANFTVVNFFFYIFLLCILLSYPVFILVTETSLKKAD